MITLRWSLFPSLLLLSSPALARPALDADDLAQLARYDVLVFADPHAGGIERGKAIGVIDATPEEVFRVATDYGKYQEYMPRVSTSKLVEQASDRAYVAIAAELPWPAGMTYVYARYIHEKLADDIYKVRFDMVNGTFKQYLGSLYIEPWSPGKTAITYELVAQPDMLAPASAVNRGIRRSAGKFVHALRQRINELHRLGLLHPEPLAPAPGPAPLAGAVHTDRPATATIKARR
jgi:ribosome-associated toxin RatA of RatAB toxin-antitoxin module